jgi:hypothetical protein
MAETLSGYPYVIVRLACTECSRTGSYRLARLAEKYGAQIDMLQLLEFLAGDCRYWGRPRHPIHKGCGAYFCDLESGKPPDLPGPRLRAVGRPIRSTTLDSG